MIVTLAAALFIVLVALFLLDFALAVLARAVSAAIEEAGAADTLTMLEKLRVACWAAFSRKRARAFGAAIKEGRTARAAYLKANGV